MKKLTALAVSILLSVPIAASSAQVTLTTDPGTGTHGDLRERYNTNFTNLNSMMTEIYIFLYAAGQTFAAGDIVLYDGQIFRALQEATGQTPAEGAYWTKDLATASKYQLLDADLTAIAALECDEDQTIVMNDSDAWVCGTGGGGTGDVLKTGTINAEEYAVWSDDTTLKALTGAEVKTALDLEAGTDFLTPAAVDSAASALDDAFTGSTNIVTVGAISTGSWAADVIPAEYLEINDADAETSIASNDKLLIYDTSAGANRSMTRDNFVTGIGAGQAIKLDLGDDDVNESEDLGEIAISGTDTNSIFTESSADKLLINVDADWPQADLADTVTVSDDESSNDNQEVVFTTDNATLESDGDFTYNPSTGVVTATGFAGALTGNVTGNVSGTAATVTGAAQSNITSVGTLTSLTSSGAIAAGTSFVIGDADVNETELEIIDGATADTADINIIDGISDSGTLTAAELLHVDGVTSAIQTQINARAEGAASSTDNAFPRFDSTTGKVLQAGQTTEDDSGNVVIVGTVTTAGVIVEQTTDPQDILIAEGSAGGTDYRGFTVPAVLSSSLLYELPNGEPTANDVFLIGAAGSGESALSYGTFSTDNFLVSGGAITIKDAGVSIAELNATGTPSSSTYLRGDGSWQTGTSTPADGDTNDIQFNSSDSFSSDTAFTYNPTTNTFNVTQASTNPTITTGDGTYSPNRTPQLYVEGVSEFDGVLYADNGATVTGVINTSVGLDAVGAVDLDIGSTDVTDITFISDGDYVFTPPADTDITMTFTGTTSSGEFKWMEDEDYFQFSDAVVFDLAATFTTAPNLAADSVDALTEIAAALKSGADATLVTGTEGDADDILVWDANGDAISSGEALSEVVTAARVGGASGDLDDTDASVEWENAAALGTDGSLSDNAVVTADITDANVTVEKVENDLKTHVIEFVYSDATETDDGLAIFIPTGASWNYAYSRCDDTEEDLVYTVYYHATGGTLAELDTFAHDSNTATDSEDISSWATDPAAGSWLTVKIETGEVATNATACTVAFTLIGN
jgi:hypothetical protein